jgi:uncharacterized protein YqgC (DUF456 family)
VRTADLVAGVAILVGLAGIVVPVLPGPVLIAVAVVGWAWAVGEGVAWAAAAVAVVILAVGQVVKYAVPGRNLKSRGVPNRSLLTGAVLGVVGFFVVPVVGLFVGFVAGVYVSEAQRVGRRLAWPSTKTALKAVGLAIMIELTAGLLAAAAWFAGAVAT